MATRRIMLAAALLTAWGTALAQDKPVAEVKPLPAEIMPLAAKSMLLDVEDTGARLVAVGERGHIVASLDGERWVQAPSPTRATLNAVAFANENVGWAVGHDAVILATRDGGKSWVLQNFKPELEKPFIDIIVLSTTRAIAVGAYSLMYVTNDGGKTWVDYKTPIREDEWHFNKVVKLNNGDLFIAGEAGTLAISQDGGGNWESVDTPYQSSFFGATAFSESGVVIFGLRGNAFYAEDAREPDWQQLDTGQENSLIGGASLPNGEIILVGNNGVIFESLDGLSDLRSINNPVGKTLAAVQPVKGGLIVVGEEGTQLIKR